MGNDIYLHYINEFTESERVLQNHYVGKNKAQDGAQDTDYAIRDPNGEQG